MPKYNRLVLSAKRCTLQNFIAWLRLFMYNKNRRDPMAELWQTRQFISAIEETLTIIETLFTIRNVGFNPVIWYTLNTTEVKFR